MLLYLKLEKLERPRLPTWRTEKICYQYLVVTVKSLVIVIWQLSLSPGSHLLRFKVSTSKFLGALTTPSIFTLHMLQTPSPWHDEATGKSTLSRKLIRFELLSALKV